MQTAISINSCYRRAAWHATWWIYNVCEGQDKINSRRKRVRESIYRSQIRLINPVQIIITLFLTGVIACDSITQTCQMKGPMAGKKKLWFLVNSSKRTMQP